MSSADRLGASWMLAPIWGWRLGQRQVRRLDRPLSWSSRDTMPDMGSSCTGQLSEPSPGDFQCSMGVRCAVAATIHILRDPRRVACATDSSRPPRLGHRLGASGLRNQRTGPDFGVHLDSDVIATRHPAMRRGFVGAMATAPMRSDLSRCKRSVDMATGASDAAVRVDAS
jgi:hypothetical protein